jgi:hypothetical protein
VLQQRRPQHARASAARVGVVSDERVCGPQLHVYSGPVAQALAGSAVSLQLCHGPVIIICKICSGGQAPT